MGQIGVVAIMVILLAGCTTAAGTFCDIAKPIRLTKPTIAAMTDGEVKDVLALNRKGAKLCGWRRP